MSAARADLSEKNPALFILAKGKTGRKAEAVSAAIESCGDVDGFVRLSEGNMSKKTQNSTVSCCRRKDVAS